jgi:DNA invertase Pin-like site-specific DNA recombinase
MSKDQRKAALYLRLARDDTPDLHLLATQQTAVGAAAEAAGWHVVAVFSDIGSGLTADRPGLQQTLTRAHAGDYDALWTKDEDRLARRLSLLASIIAALQHAGACLITSDGRSCPTSHTLTATDHPTTPTPATRRVISRSATRRQP